MPGSEGWVYDVVQDFDGAAVGVEQQGWGVAGAAVGDGVGGPVDDRLDGGGGEGALDRDQEDLSSDAAGRPASRINIGFAA